MKIQLGKFKAYHSRSEETLNFTATIVVDGKTVGTVENQGFGGSCMEHFTDKAAEAAVRAHVAALPEETTEYGPIKVSMDYFFATLADEAVKAQDEAKLARKLNRFAMDAKARGMHAFVGKFTDPRGAFTMMWEQRDADIVKARTSAETTAKKKKATVVSVELLA